MTTKNSQNYLIALQKVTDYPIPVQDDDLINWSNITLQKHIKKAELTLRLVSKHEIHELNLRYRQQDKPTNVLAFPSQIPDFIPLEYSILGDVILCPEIIYEESLQQHKSLQAHWAHITIHGILHLLGFDHINPDDEIIMQTQEITILNQLGFPNPYLELE